ncbi:hypothetical protein C8Q70DRAFT_1046854 [Cubamyces menziesii]|nr:hypothetical protein C8Q70DRAFT_1046854 [Cubamyces menziesii]
MRAAISHKYGREYKLGTQPWTESAHAPGTYLGNPSLSVLVSQYMVSLRRRKVRSGEIVTSARAIDEETMKKLWDFNRRFPQQAELNVNSRKRKQENPELWAGYKVRQMLQTLYTVSMLCLLRYDEALRIMWSDIEFLEHDGTCVVKLSLPFRKTSQTGGIAPFYLWPDKERPWMDGVTAFAQWWSISNDMGIEPSGYVFRSRIHYDEVNMKVDAPMSSDSFMECFRNNMVDINIDPRPYGMHSFRRGGCQYLAIVLRWPIRNICEWGGWAENFDNPGTIFRYLLSWVDSPTMDRKDYFNPYRLGTDPCTMCGRTCHCS